MRPGCRDTAGGRIIPLRRGSSSAADCLRQQEIDLIGDIESVGPIIDVVRPEEHQLRQELWCVRVNVLCTAFPSERCEHVEQPQSLGPARFADEFYRSRHRVTSAGQDGTHDSCRLAVVGAKPIENRRERVLVDASRQAGNCVGRCGFVGVPQEFEKSDLFQIFGDGRESQTAAARSS